jgi:hypothetical protein
MKRHEQKRIDLNLAKLARDMNRILCFDEEVVRARVRDSGPSLNESEIDEVMREGEPPSGDAKVIEFPGQGDKP